MAGSIQASSGGIGFRKWAGRTLAALSLGLVGAACSGGGSTDSGAGASGISYSGPTTWTISGPQGGPFQNRSMDVLLENHGSAPIDWSASSVPSFVVLDQTSGTIPGNSQASVHAALDPQQTGSLPVGNSFGLLAFHNESEPQNDIGIDTTLSVSAPGVSISLTPTADFNSTGPASGPFVPPSKIYTLTNTGSGTLNWSSNAADSWVSVSPSAGQLAPGNFVDVTLTIDEAQTGALDPGLYWSSVGFTDGGSGTTLDSRDVALNVDSDTVNGGWTVFTPSVDTRMVFVSSSQGNDSNDGLSQNTPKRTIAAGKALMRNNFPDWLLLKCGDTWDEPIGTWSNSGRSLTEPTLISSYGTGDRPFLRTGTTDGVVPAYLTNPYWVSIVGLHFKAHLYNGTNGAPKGVNWIRHNEGFLLEDCYIERYPQNVVIQGFNETNGDQMPNRHTNVRIRRNIISEAYNCVNSGGSSGMSANGLFVTNVDGILIEENVFDHNGTVDSIPGAIPIWFRHNGYVCNGNTGVILRGNIIYGTDSVMMRAGGLVENNLYLENYNALLYGLGIEPEPAGVAGTIRDNVVLGSRNYGDNTGAFVAGGLCIDMGNISQSLIDNNIFAHNTLGTAPRPLQVHDDHNYGNYRVVENTTISNNIVYDWGGTTFDINTATGGSNQQPVNLQFVGNIFENSRDTSPLIRHAVSASLAGVTGSNNHFSSLAGGGSWFQVNGAGQTLSQWKASLAPPDTTSSAGATAFPDPNRTITTYQASLGGAPTIAAFITECRLQSRANWRAQYTANAVNEYIRAGFGR
jgi:hypothetical protein